MPLETYEQMGESFEGVQITPNHDIDFENAPPTPHHPILLPNISTFATPQMDKTFPERLSGYVSREEHEEFLEQVNEELQKLVVEDVVAERMGRWIWPTKRIGLLFVFGSMLVVMGLVTKNQEFESLGVVVVVASALILVPACCYLVYLAYMHDTASEAVVETVTEMSIEKFYSRLASCFFPFDSFSFFSSPFFYSLHPPSSEGLTINSL